jgi:DNA polymerase-3 subunit alpha
LGGLCKIGRTLDKCADLNMEAMALTDEGNLFGAVEFQEKAQKKGIKSIIGAELYVAPTNRLDRNARSEAEAGQPLLLLCETVQGYHNLCKLSTLGYLEGQHIRPRVDDDLLGEYHGGLIAIPNRLESRLQQLILAEKEEAARELVQKYMAIFGPDRFALGMTDHGLVKEREVNGTLHALASEYGLMTVALNNCYYVDQADADAHDALLCMQYNTKIEEENRPRLPNDQYYFCSGDEMAERFAAYPQAVANTVAIADRCNVEIPLGMRLIPEYKVPEGKEAFGYLEELVLAGVKERYGDPPPQEYVDRAHFELDIIKNMQFVDYFLVVWDLINFARKEGIPVGPGRGSGAGSIVAYALEITNIDPMRYQLLFERFLNPERVSMPDFDIDFCIKRRPEMIDYSYETYGRENVSQIITFGKMLARNVVRNVGRVMGLPYGEVDRIAKLVPDELKITLNDAVEKEPELKRIIAEDPQTSRLWDLALRLEGTVGNCGTHAAGVVICDHPLTDHVALYKAEDSETVATQVEMKNVEEVGLLKMDFLGLRNLTVIHNAVDLIREGRGKEIDIDHLAPTDPRAYEVLRSGHTTGIFQLESSGMRDLAKRIGLETLEEISALVALYRPGPMQFIDTYIQNKYNQDQIKYDHPLLEPILKETYGIAVYQEQVMQIVQTLAGFSLGEADIMRRAMGKKKKELMAEQREKFTKGCKETNDIDEKLATLLFDNIETFAGYGFNKSHSVAYSYVAYQTAFLKGNYPVEFLCALLTSETNNLGKVAIYVAECKRLDIPVLPPDINRSEVMFSVEDHEGGKLNAIRFGLSAIKNVGEEACKAVVNERNANGPFEDIYDVCSRCDTREVNRRLLESLNKAGVFVSTGWNRRQVEQVLDDAVGEGQSAQRDRLAGQSSLFDMDGMEDAVASMRRKPDVVEWPEYEVLQLEKEMLGLYISNHPLSNHSDTLDRYATLDIVDIPNLKEHEERVIGGLVATVRPYVPASGKKMAFVTLETLEGSAEFTVFNDLFESKGGLLAQDMIVLVKVKASYRRSKNDDGGGGDQGGRVDLLANDILPIEEAEKHFARAVHIRVPAGQSDRDTLDKVAGILGDAPGECDVFLHCDSPGVGEVTVHATSACRVTITRALKFAVEDLLGEESIWFSAGKNLPTHRPPEPQREPDLPPWKRRKAKASA